MTRTAPRYRSTNRFGHVHVEIAKVAKDAAAAHYEELMSASNWSFDQWKLRHPALAGEALCSAFVAENWGKYIGFAKATMAHLLTLATIDEKTKDAIVTALALDATLTRGRGDKGPPSQVLNPGFGRIFTEK